MGSQLWKHVAIGGVCLAVGAAGTAGASSLITGKGIKDGTIETKDLSKKARKALTGKRGPRGATGPRGPAGQNGAPGGPGTSGSTAPALMIGSMSVAAGGSRFAPPLGGGGTFLTEPGAQVPVPPGTGLVARDLAAQVPAAPGGGQSITLTFRVNGADTPLSCTIAGGATTCQISSAAVPLPAGAQMSMESTASAGATASSASWGFRVVF